MVITRSAYKRATESFNSSDISQNNIITMPPWCSSGNVYVRRKSRKALPSWEAQSSYALRENIWEYLNERSDHFNVRQKTPQRQNKSKVKKKSTAQTIFKLLLFLLVGLGIIVPLWIQIKIPKTDLLKSLISPIKLLGFVSLDSTTAREDCCDRLRHLVMALPRLKHDLRKTQRFRRNIMQSSFNTKTKSTIYTSPKSLIHGANAVKGDSTVEWGIQVALWGVIPLWRPALPPNTILALRQPKPSDCWPFSGSYGEVIIELPQKISVNSLSLEHVRPDTARSAPKNFIVYGVLENGTYVKAADGIYRYNMPAKQYYSLNNEIAPVRRIVFRVLSNHGNPKYTCIYRVHVYKSNKNKFKF